MKMWTKIEVNLNWRLNFETKCNENFYSDSNGIDEIRSNSSSSLSISGVVQMRSSPSDTVIQKESVGEQATSQCDETILMTSSCQPYNRLADGKYFRAETLDILIEYFSVFSTKTWPVKSNILKTLQLTKGMRLWIMYKFIQNKFLLVTMMHLSRFACKSLNDYV